MPGFARIGDGLVRTRDLLDALREDVQTAYAELEVDRPSQFKRRCVARAIFSFIEAAVECIKVEVRSTVRKGNSDPVVNEKDRETLETLTLVGPRSTKFLPLYKNLKCTFKLAAKVWKIDFRLSTDGEAFRSFAASKRARDLLAHPKTYYDIEVTDTDMHHYSVTYEWFRGELHRLFSVRAESLLKGLSEDDALAIRQVTGRGSDA